MIVELHKETEMLKKDRPTYSKLQKGNGFMGQLSKVKPIYFINVCGTFPGVDPFQDKINYFINVIFGELVCYNSIHVFNYIFFFLKLVWYLLKKCW